MTSVPREGDTKYNVLVAIRDHYKSSRKGPSVEDLRVVCGLNARSTVQFHINDLVADGYLSQVPGKRRTLRVTKKGEMLISILEGQK